MESIKLKPEKELKTLWIITWVVALVLGILFLLFFIFVAGVPVTIFLLTGWIVIMIPVIIWIPYAFRALEYSIDDEGVKMKSGVIWKKFVTVPYHKITNVDITQGPMQRYYNIGTIHVQTAGAGGQQGQKAELKLNGIKELDKARDIIIGKVKDSTYTSGSVERNIKGGMLRSRPEDTGKESIFNDILEELKEIKMLLKERQG